MSPALIVPLIITSARKLPAPTATPDCDFTKPTSPAFTVPLPIRVADKHSHRNHDITGVGSIAHVLERNAKSLNVGHPGEINGDHRCATPAKGGAPSARRYRHTGQRNGAGKGYYHLIHTRAVAAFDPDSSTDGNQRQIDIASKGSVHLTRDSAARHRRTAGKISIEATGTPVPSTPTAQTGFGRAGGYDGTGVPVASMEIFPSVLVPSSAVSRKVHGAFTGDINLPVVAIGGAVGIECRNGAGVYQMVVTFPSPVTVSGCDGNVRHWERHL